MQFSFKQKTDLSMKGKKTQSFKNITKENIFVTLRVIKDFFFKDFPYWTILKGKKINSVT